MFSTCTDDSIKLKKNESVVDMNKEMKRDDKNLDIYNRLRFSGVSELMIHQSYTRVNEEKREVNFDDTLQFEVSTQIHSSDTDEIDSNCSTNSFENEKREFIEKNEEWQNLISSFSEIPESYCAEEEGELQSAASKASYENNCNLESVCGLSEAKETLYNIFIYPSIYPRLFPRKVRRNQILLYGPPGTGKTMLARGIAMKINATLHSISSSDLLSHWQGETEKRIRNLFEEARTSLTPVVLFFDEIDGLCRRRTNTEDDSVRRIKTELLTQLDDFMSETDSHQTYIIGATNCPWEIDSGFMRRFHRKIFIPLPDKEARLDILKKNFEEIETDLTESEWDDIGNCTEGYSGSDLANVVMTSCCERFTQMKKSKYWEVKGDIWFPAGSNTLFSTRMNFEDIHPDKMGSRNIILADLKAAIASTPRTVGPEELFKYLEFSAKIK